MLIAHSLICRINLNLPALPRCNRVLRHIQLGHRARSFRHGSFKDAKPDKKNYRKFKIKTFDGQDDFAAVNEVVSRRYKR